MNTLQPEFAFRPVPRIYDEVMVPLYFQPYATETAQRLAALRPKQVLETACGTGVLSRALEQSLPSATAITATDFNPEMLAYAKDRSGIKSRISWQQADATDLPFGDGIFDVVVCQFGTMFFPDKDKGFSEAWRVLSPGGTFMFSVWDSMDKNPVSRADRSVYKEYFGGNLPANVLTAFSMHDASLVIPRLEAASFSAIQSEVITFPCEGPEAEVLATAMLDGGSIRNALKGASPEAIDTLKHRLRDTLSAQFGSPVRSTMQAILFTAHKPANGS